MAGHIEHLDLQIANLEMLAFNEEMIEIAAVGLQIRSVEDRAEDALDIADMFANADLRARLRLDIGGAGEVVRMGVGLQNPFDLIARLSRRLQHGAHRARVHRGDRVIIVEDRIDDRRLARRRIGHEVADRVGGLIEEAPDDGLAGLGLGHGLVSCFRSWGAAPPCFLTFI